MATCWLKTSVCVELPKIFPDIKTIKHFRLHWAQLCCLLCIAVLGVSCVNRKYRGTGRYLLKNQKIVGNDYVDDYYLENLYEQEANRRLVSLEIMPYLYFYQFGEQFYDSTQVQKRFNRKMAKLNRKMEDVPEDSKKEKRLEKKKEKLEDRFEKRLKEGNFLMRIVGEPPVFYEQKEAEETAKKMRNYLFNRGYFNAEVDYEADTTWREKVKVRYHVAENKGFYVQDIQYESSNDRILALIKIDSANQAITTGDIYKEEKLVKEQSRISKTLRDNGYFGFNKEFIYFQVDTTLRSPDSTKGAVAIKCIIRNPKKGVHRYFRMNKISMKIKSPPGRDSLPQMDTVYVDSIRFIFEKDNYKVAPLRHKIFVDKGEIYNHSKLIKSQAYLASLDLFSFVNLSVDTSGRSTHVHFEASRIKSFQTSEEVGLVVSRITPGPFFDVGFKIRNPLKRLDILDITGRYSLEGAISPNSSPYISQEIGGKVNWTFPNIFFPIKPVKLWLDEYNPKTHFSVSITNTQNLYHQTVFRSAMGYDIFPHPHNFEVVKINPIDISLVQVPRDKIDGEFRDYLQELEGLGNPFLLQSFQTSLNTNFNVSYTFNNFRPEKKERSFYFNTVLEYGGLIPQLAKRYGALPGGEDTIVGVKFFQYARGSVDWRLYQPTNRYTMLVFRAKAGIVYPHNVSTSVPPNKFFFSGGTNSIRAWQPFTVGLGTSEASKDNRNALQLGEFLIEANFEARVDLFDYVEGAWFVDAGNVWNLSERKGQEGAEISGQFWRNLAVGTGPGIRLDFNFVIVRFDVGMKVYDPAYRLENRIRFLRSDPVLNFGVGYPF